MYFLSDRLLTSSRVLNTAKERCLDNLRVSSQGAEEFARSFASSFTLCTATHIDVRAIPLSVWRRIAGERRLFTLIKLHLYIGSRADRLSSLARNTTPHTQRYRAHVNMCSSTQSKTRCKRPSKLLCTLCYGRANSSAPCGFVLGTDPFYMPKGCQHPVKQ